jgi:hypothetical protein
MSRSPLTRILLPTVLLVATTVAIAESPPPLTDAEIGAQIEKALERGRTQPPTPTAPVPAPTPGATDNSFKPVMRRHDGFTAYHFPDELAQHKVYQVAATDDGIWAGTSHGLVRYQPEKDRWTRIALPPQTGASGVPYVVAAGKRLAVGLWHYPKAGQAVPKGAWWYEPGAGRWQRIAAKDALVPLHWDGAQLWLRHGRKIQRHDPVSGSTREYSDKDHAALKTVTVGSMLVSGHEAWFCTRGTQDPKTKQFNGGGVLRLHLQSGNWRHYTHTDGLGHDYCAAIAADTDNIWVAHGEEKKGVSRFHRKEYRWEALPQALNAAVIGGVKLASEQERLWIGQQRGLAWYDKHTRNGFTYTEKHGLPGDITGGLTPGRDAIWAGLYALGDRSFHGVRSAGLVRLPYTPGHSQTQAGHGPHQ